MKNNPGQQWFNFSSLCDWSRLLAPLSLAAQCGTVVLIGHCDFHLSLVLLIAEMNYTEAYRLEDWTPVRELQVQPDKIPVGGGVTLDGIAFYIHHATETEISFSGMSHKARLLT